VDEIAAVFWSFQDPVDELADNAQQKARRTGIIVVENKQLHPSRLRDFIVGVVDTELELLNEVVDVVMDLDPDIVIGWEVQAASWGYLSARGRQYGLYYYSFIYMYRSVVDIATGFDIGDLISRSPSRNLGGGGDQWGMRQTSTFRANGRQVLNLWRIMRSEQNLSMYSFGNVVFHVLGKRSVNTEY
jgi:DNA polymerase zeta